MFVQALLEKLQGTGAQSDSKPGGKATAAKSAVKASAKAAVQAEAAATPDTPAVPPPADLTVIARLQLSQVCLIYPGVTICSGQVLQANAAACETFPQVLSILSIRFFWASSRSMASQIQRNHVVCRVAKHESEARACLLW